MTRLQILLGRVILMKRGHKAVGKETYWMPRVEEEEGQSKDIGSGVESDAELRYLKILL